MPEYDAGTAALSVFPSFRGVQQLIRKEAQSWGTDAGKSFADAFNAEVAKGTGKAPLGPDKPTSTRSGTNSGGSFADGFKKRVQAALKSMPDVKIGAATTEAEQKIKDLTVQLQTLSKQTVGIDIDDASALAELDRIRAELEQVSKDSGSIQVKADTSAALAELNKVKEAADKVGADSPTVTPKVETDKAEAEIGSFATKVRAELDAAVSAIPEIKIDADSTAADFKLAALRAQLQGLAGTTIGVDINETEALAEIESVRLQLAQLSADSPSIRIAVDAATAETKLAAIKAEADDLGTSSPTITPKVDPAAALAGIGAIQSAMSLLSVGGLLAPLAVGIASLGGPLIAAAAGFVGMAAVAIPAAVNIKKALDAQSKATADAAKAAATLKTANGQVASAQQGLATAQQNAANQAVTSNEQVQKSEQTLADAERDTTQQRIAAQQAVADAQREGSRQITAAQQAVASAVQQAASQQQSAENQVKTAEQGLAQAQVSAKAAQVALTQARKDAAQQLKELAFQNEDASLQQQQDIINVKEAQEALDATLANKKSSTLQKQQAALNLAQAKQALKEQQDQTKQLAAQKAIADKKGVSGSDQVVSATQNVSQAHQNVAQQQQAVIAAQKNVTAVQLAGAKAVEQAQTKLAQTRQDSARTIQRAQSSLQQTEIRGAEQVQNAQQGVSDAVRAQAQQSQQSAQSVQKAQGTLSKALAAQKTAQEGAATSADKAKNALKNLTPQERAAAGQFEAFKGAFKDWAKELEPKVLPAFTGALTLFGGALSPLSGAISGTSGAIVGLERDAGKAFKSPFWKSFSTFLGKESGTAVTDLGKAFGHIATGLAGMFQGLAPLGNNLLGIFDDVTGDFSNWGQKLAKNGPGSTLKSIIGLGSALWGLFKKLAPLIAPLIQVIEVGLTGAVKALSFVFTPLITFMDNHKTIFKIVAGGLIAAAAAMVILNFAMDANPIVLVILAIAALASGIIALVNNWGTVKRGIIAAANAVWGFLKKWGPLILLAIAPVIGIPLLIWQHFSLIKHYVVKAFDGSVGWLKKAGSAIISGLWSGIKTAYRAVTSFFSGIAGSVVRTVGNLGHTLYSKGAALIGGFFTAQKNGWTAIAKWLGGMAVRAVKAIGNLGKTLYDKGKALMQGFGDGVLDVAGKIGGWLEKPLNAVIGVLNKFIHLINKIPGVNIPDIGKVGQDKPKKSPKEDGGGTGGGGDHALATGGVLPGFTPGKDVHHFFSPTAGRLHLSGGEAIMRPEFTRAVGGEAGVAALNRWATGGASAGESDGSHFLFGGVIKDIGKFGSWAGKKAKKGAEAINPVRLANEAYDGAVHAAFHVANSAANDIPTSLGKQIGHGILGAIQNAILHDGHADTKKNLAGGEGGGSFINFAKQFLGQPYVWGGSEPGGFDCSGLTSYVMNHFGLHSPRTATQQEAWATPISQGAALPGDLVFYGGSVGKGGAHHVAFYDGNNKILEAQQTGVPILIDALRSGGHFGRAPGAGPFLGGGLQGGTGLQNLVGTGGSAAANRALGQKIAVQMGYGSQFAAIDYVASHESGWNNLAQNPKSTAYGIGQFLNSTWPAYGGKTSDPARQIEDMIQYMVDRYESPTGAEQFWMAHHSYDSGGPLPPGFTMAYNGTGETEHVFTADQMRALASRQTDAASNVPMRIVGSLDMGNGLTGMIDGRIEKANLSTASALAGGRRVGVR